MKASLSIFSAVVLAVAVCNSVSAQTIDVKNLKPTGDMSALVQAIESAPLYPVFVIPMGGGYFDFELKASVTNWAGATIPDTMVYWYASAVDSQPSLPIWDAAPKIFFTNPEGVDARAWLTANPASSIFSQFGAGAANSKINSLVVIPSKLTGSSAWMFKGNTHLVWSYCRIASGVIEKDAANHIVWNPIVPSDWRAAQTSP